jgi:hypothetical protein
METRRGDTEGEGTQKVRTTWEPRGWKKSRKTLKRMIYLMGGFSLSCTLLFCGRFFGRRTDSSAEFHFWVSMVWGQYKARVLRGKMSKNLHLCLRKTRYVFWGALLPAVNMCDLYQLTLCFPASRWVQPMGVTDKVSKVRKRWEHNQSISLLSSHNPLIVSLY